MSQPDSNPSTDGASALLAAAEKSEDGPRRKRYVPKAKEPKAAAPAEPPAAPQEPADNVEPASASEDTGEPGPAAQAAAQPETAAAETPTVQEAPTAPPEAPPAPPAEDKPESKDAPPGEDKPPARGPSSTADVGFPATPLRFESVFTRPTHSMDPEMYAMFKQRQEKILKSLANIVTMFLDRKAEYEGAVRTAVTAGFPKDELAKLAVQYDCAPFLEAVLGEQLSQ